MDRTFNGRVSKVSLLKILGGNFRPIPSHLWLQLRHLGNCSLVVLGGSLVFVPVHGHGVVINSRVLADR